MPHFIFKGLSTNITGSRGLRFARTLKTIIKLLWAARQGIRFKDKKLVVLTAGLGIMAHHRVKLRSCFLREIERSANGDFIDIRINRYKKTLRLSLRRGNEADYLMAGEMLRGSYEMPDFEPKEIIDGGANIGMFSICARHRFPGARLLCYEPDKNNFRQLQRNLEINSMHAELHPLGLWSREATLYYHRRTAETGFIDEQPPGIPVPCVLPIINEDCWLKLDVEGAEHEILPVLFKNQACPRWISMEVHFFNTRGRDLLSLLNRYGYIVSGGNDPKVDCTVISAHR